MQARSAWSSGRVRSTAAALPRTASEARNYGRSSPGSASAEPSALLGSRFEPAEIQVPASAADDAMSPVLCRAS
jgi:hypothetical protein